MIQMLEKMEDIIRPVWDYVDTHLIPSLNSSFQRADKNWPEQSVICLQGTLNIRPSALRLAKRNIQSAISIEYSPTFFAGLKGLIMASAVAHMDKVESVTILVHPGESAHI